MLKKTISVLLSVLMLCGLVPLGTLQSYAAETEQTVAADLSGSESGGGYPELTVGTPVEVSSSGEDNYHSFVPSKTCEYIFYSTGSVDTVGYLYDSEMNQVGYDDDSGSGNNFRIAKTLTAGVTYTLKTYLYSHRSGSYTLNVERHGPADSIELLPGDTMKGFVRGTGTLSVNYIPEGSVEETVSWSSSNASVVSVDDSGVMTYNAVGTAVITAELPSGPSAQCTVTVEAIPSISTSSPKTAQLSPTAPYAIYKYSPGTTGAYSFTAESSETVYLALLDSSMNELEHQIKGGDPEIEYEPTTPDPNESPDATVSRWLTKGSVNYVLARFSKNVSGSVNLSVKRLPAASSMTITQGEQLEGFKNSTIKLSASFAPESAYQEKAEWSSSDSNIVSVDSSGAARLLSIGTAVITAVSESGLTASCEITVNAYPLLTVGTPTEVTTSGEEVFHRFIAGNTCEYTFYSTGNVDTVGYLYDADMNEIGYNDDGGSGNNFKIKKTLTKGVEYTLKSYLYSHRSGSYALNVEYNGPAQSIAVLPGSTMKGYKGGTCALSVSFLPAGASAEDISWSSSNTSVVTVDESGIMTYKATGTATVTASTAGGLTAQCAVTVAAIPSIALDTDKTESLEPLSPYMIYKFVPDDNARYVFTAKSAEDVRLTLFDSSMNELETQTKGGGIIPEEQQYLNISRRLNKGKTYYIRAEFTRSVSGSVTLRVSKLPHAESVRIEGKDFTGMEDDELSLSVSFAPKGSEVEAVTWTSSDTNVATVSTDGLVSLHAPGTAVISVVSEFGLTDSVTVTSLAYERIRPGDRKIVYTSYEKNSGIFKFVPDETRFYAFYSAGSSDLDSTLLDSEKNVINSCYDKPMEIVSELTAGQTYYISASLVDHNGVDAFGISLIACPDAEKLTLASGNAVKGYPGETVDIEASFLPRFALSEEITWTSKDPSVAAVDEEGRVTFVSAGSTTITATSEKGLKAECAAVTKPYTDLSAGETKTAEIEVGEGYTLFRLAPAEDAYMVLQSVSDEDTCAILYDSEMQWLANNDDGGEGQNFRITRLLNAGQIYYLKAYYYSSRLTGSIPVSATAIPFADSMTLRQGSAVTAMMHGRIEFIADISPEDSYEEGVTWSSSAPDIVSINDEGTASCNALGSAVITAVSERGLNASCTVTVIGNPTLTIGETRNCKFSYAGQEIVYAINFPEEYAYSFSTSSDIPVAISVYDENRSSVNSVSGSTVNRLKTMLEAGKTYYVAFKADGEDYSGSCTLTSQKEEYVTGVTIVSTPTKNSYVRGYVEGYIQYDGLTVDVSWSDGVVYRWTVGQDPNIRDERISSVLYTTTIYPSQTKTYSVSVRCGGKSASYSINQISNPVSSIEVISGSVTVEDYTDGSMATRYDSEKGHDVDYFRYNYDYPSHVMVRIHMNDGTAVDARVGSLVDGYPVTISDTQSSSPWVRGGENSLTAVYLGKRASIPVTVLDNNVASVKAVGRFSSSLIENLDGIEDERKVTDLYGTHEETFFRYDLDSLGQIPVCIKMKDGTVIYAMTGEYVDGYEVLLSADQYENPFTVGSSNEVTVSYRGKSDTALATVSGVEGIELVSATEKKYVQNGEGNFGTSAWGEAYFRYDDGRSSGELCDEADYEGVDYDFDDFNDAVIRICYSDGTSRTAHVGESVDGHLVTFRDYQPLDPWTVGGNNLVTIEYARRTTAMNVEVVPSPVKSMTLNTAPTGLYVFDDAVYGGSEYFSPTNLDGLSFTVTYLDNTTKTFTSDDIRDGRIDGSKFRLRVSLPQKIGLNKVTFEYLGHSFDYNVRVAATSFESIEVLELPTNSTYSYYYEPNWLGMKLRFNKKDGSSTVITVKDSNIVYGYSEDYGFFVGVRIFAGSYAIFTDYYEKRGGYSRSFAVRYADLITPIEGMTLQSESYVRSVRIKDFLLTGENMLIKTLRYDGTTEDIRLTNIKDVRRTKTGNYVRALTDKGLLGVKITDPEYRSIAGFDVGVFGRGVQCAVYGDVDGNGIVDIRDVTMIQKHLARISDIPANRLAAAKVMNGKSLTIIDATAVQKKIASLIDEFPVERNFALPEYES